MRNENLEPRASQEVRREMMVWLRDTVQFDRVFFFGVGIAVWGYIIFCVLLDYDKNWMHPAMVIDYHPAALQTGKRFVLEDLWRGFDYMGFDGAPRGRFLSYFMVIPNEKFRLWLFERVPPHPSLSITWLFSLVLSPILLFKVALNSGCGRKGAWIAVLLYLLSAGFLSNVTLLVLPAKPLANFFVILCLFLGSKIYLSTSISRDFSKKDLAQFVTMLCLIYVSFFTDETAWFIYGCVPVLYPEIFLYGKKKILRGVLFLSTFPLYLAFLTFLAPLITTKLGFGDFDFWAYAIKDNPGLTVATVMELMPKNALNLIKSYFFFTEGSTVRTIGSFLILIPLFYSAFKISLSQKLTFIKMMAVLFLFIVFNSFIMSRHMQVTPNSYLYGGLFSIFLVLPISLLLRYDKRILGVVNKICFVVLLLFFVQRFNQINSEWKYGHTRAARHVGEAMESSDGLDFKKLVSKMHDSRPTEFKKILEAWRSRNNKTFLFDHYAASFSPRDLWLFDELRRIGPDGCEMVHNGSFESGTVGWRATSCTLRSIPGGQNGDCLQITRQGGDWQQAFQDLCLEAGKTYRVVFYVKSGTSRDEAFKVAVADVGGIAGHDEGTSSVAWTRYSFSFKARYPSTSIFLVKKTATEGTMLFDSVSCEEITPDAKMAEEKLSEG